MDEPVRAMNGGVQAGKKRQNLEIMFLVQRLEKVPRRALGAN
ncbi:hypothetical protein RAD15_39630 [Bradyrhizobium sp. 14AA]